MSTEGNSSVANLQIDPYDFQPSSESDSDSSSLHSIDEYDEFMWTASIDRSVLRGTCRNKGSEVTHRNCFKILLTTQ